MVPRNQMRRQSDRGFNLGTVLGLLVRRRWTVVTVFSLLFLPVLALVFTRESKYEAELRLMVKKSAGPGVAGQIGSAGVTDTDVQAEMELIKSRELYEEAGRQAGVIAERVKPRDAALAVAAIESNLKITQVGKTNIISVKYTAQEPGTAAAIPNALAELYLKRHVALHSSDEAAQFFTDQTGIYQRQLEAAQTALTRFRQTGDVTLLQDQKLAYLRRATDLEAAVQESESSLRDLEQRTQILERQRDSQPATVETGSRVARGSATAEKLKALLIDLGNKRTELLTKYDPSYRLVKEVDKQMADARTALERESQPHVVDQTNAPNPLRLSLESEVLRIQSQMAGLRARRSTLQRDLSDYRSRQTRLESATASNNDLERAVKIAEENFLLYQRKLEEARLAEALDKQRLMNVAILEKAAVPALAASQHRTYLLLFGFLAAAFLAFASAFVSDYLERNLPTKETLIEAAAGAVEEPAPAFVPEQFERRLEAGVPTKLTAAMTATALAPPATAVMEHRALPAMNGHGTAQVAAQVAPQVAGQVMGQVVAQVVTPGPALAPRPLVVERRSPAFGPASGMPPAMAARMPGPQTSVSQTSASQNQAPREFGSLGSPGPGLNRPGAPASVDREPVGHESAPYPVTHTIRAHGAMHAGHNQAEEPVVEITRQEFDQVSGKVTTTALVVRKSDAWRELFDRRSRGAALARQSQAQSLAHGQSHSEAQKPAAKGAQNKIDPDFLRRIQDKKTTSRDNRTGTRG